MAITVNDFISLTDDLESIFNEAARVSIANMVGFKVFSVESVDRRTHDHLVLHGLDGAQKVAEGADLPNVTSVEGDSVTWTQARYGRLVPITKDMRIFDLHAQIKTLVQSTATAAFDQVDQSLADVLTNGYATSYTDVFSQVVTSTATDGLAVFSTAHTNNINATTFRNIIELKSSSTENPALSRQAIVDAKINAAVYQDPVGLIKPIRLDTLLVPPSLTDLAQRIVESPGVQGTNNVDVNKFLTASTKVMTWERLETDSQGTDRSAYFFMYDSKFVGESLKVQFKERPSLDAPEQATKSRNWEYPMDFYYAIGRGYPAYIRGSKGTNAS